MFLMFFRRILMRVRFRLLELRHRKKGTWSLTPDLLLQIANNIDITLLSGVTASTARKIELFTRFNNSAEIFELTNDLISRYTAGRHIDDGLLMASMNRKLVTLDDLLIEERGRSITAQELHLRLFSYLQLLKNAFDQSAGGDDYREYYLRKGHALHSDIFAVLEALSSAALTR